MKTTELYIRKADETYREAVFMLENKFYQACISRAYYAAYHAIQAVLHSEGLSAKTHSGTLAVFSKHFIKTEKFPIRTVKFLKENLDKRLLGDYEITFKAELHDARLAVEYSGEVISDVKGYLNP